MSYRVEYDPQFKKRYPLATTKRQKYLMRSVLITVLIVVVAYTAIRSNLTQYFIPGDPQVTAAAFSGLMKQVRTGESISEAVFCFFKEVIQNGA